MGLGCGGVGVITFNVHVDLNTHGLYGVHMGVGLGWGGDNDVHVNLKKRHATLWALTLAHIRHATLWDLLLHLHTCVMLSCEIFSCTCTHTSRYAVLSSLALCTHT